MNTRERNWADETAPWDPVYCIPSRCLATNPSDKKTIRPEPWQPPSPVVAPDIAGRRLKELLPSLRRLDARLTRAFEIFQIRGAHAATDHGEVEVDVIRQFCWQHPQKMTSQLVPRRTTQSAAPPNLTDRVPVRILLTP